MIFQSPVQAFEDDTEVQPEPAQPTEPIQPIQQEDKSEVLKKEEEEIKKEIDSPRRSITPTATNGLHNGDQKYIYFYIKY